MKRKSQSLKDLLGISQEDLAMVLKVSRSHFSRFELGMGDLPIAAKSLFIEMLQYMSDPETAVQQPEEIKKQQSHKDHILIRMHKENEYQLETVRRKLARIETSYTNNIKTLRLLEFLKARKDEVALIELNALNLIADKVTKVMKEQSMAALCRLKLKLELLHLEKILLDAEIRKSTKSLVFIDSK